jgi:integrase
MKGVLAHLSEPLHHTMVLVAAVTALRRSEIRVLKWRDVDFENRWLSLRRGVVRKHTTKMKREGSRKGIPNPPELSMVLLSHREQSLYPGGDDWIFASSTTGGRSPLWLDPVLNIYVRPPASWQTGERQCWSSTSYF